MGGLLDKANAAKETEDTQEPAPVKAAADVPNVAEGSKAHKIVQGNSESSNIFSNASKVGLGLGGLAFILMWFLGSYLLEDLTGPVPFGLVVLGIFGASFYMVWDSIEREKTAVLAVIYILLAAVPYGAGLLGGGFVGITDIAYLSLIHI